MGRNYTANHTTVHQLPGLHPRFSIFLSPAHPHGPFTCADPSEGQTAFYLTAFLMDTDSLGQSVLPACLDLITINNSLPVITHERQLSVLTSQISLKINLVTEPDVSQIRPINCSQLTPKMSPDVDSCSPSPHPLPALLRVQLATSGDIFGVTLGGRGFCWH